MSEQATEMEVRVAKAICVAEVSYVDVDACYGYNCAGEFVPGGEGGETKPHAWMWFVPHARAAIRAMREPTKEMIEGAYGDHETDWGVGVVNQAGIYTAMIDAATAPIQESPATATASNLESPART